MTHLVIYHPDTGTIVGLDDCCVIEVPDDLREFEEIEAYCERDLPVEKRVVTVDFAPVQDDQP